MRRFLIIILCIVGMRLSISNVVQANTSHSVVITAYGYICDLPGGLTISYISDYEVGLSWMKGNGSTNTMIRSSLYGYPSNISDGSLVYNGNGTFCVDDVNIIDNNLYYRAWAQGSTGIWTGLYISKEESLMSQSYLFMGMIVIAIAATYFAFKTTAVLIRLGAATSWLSVILFVMSSSKTLVFTNPWVVSLFMGVFCMVVGVLLLYAGKEIDKGWITHKKKDKRSRGQISQDTYRVSLKNLGKKAK